jgi:glycerate 2-kinase
MTEEQRASPREILIQLYEAAVQRALPLHNTAACLPPPPKGRTIVFGAGKALRSNWALCHS